LSGGTDRPQQGPKLVLPESAGTDRQVREIFDTVRRRALMRHVLQSGIAAFLALAALALIVAPSRGVLLVFAAGAMATIAASFRVRSQERTARALAASLESRRPDLQNLAITAEELLRHPDRAPAWVRERVFADAAAALRPLQFGDLWPIGRLAAGVVAAAAVAATAFALTPRDGARSVVRALIPGVAKASVAVDVELTPPPYTRRPVVRLRDPERLEAIAGTVARVTMANARGVRIRFGARSLAVRSADGLVVAETILADGGYLAIEIGEADGSARLIPVTVVPDRIPSVRIERPARDLLLPDARSSVDVTGSVADDIAINALTLHYTKVSGSGEQIEFVEGELPLQIAKDSEQQWRAHGPIALPRLGLEPGDSLVYRLVAQDGRTGEAGRASSDTYFIEIAGPGQVPLEGVEMPPEQERYALSQQMIVLKIRRLRERERGLPPASLEEQAHAIAAEQRSVRANFVFLMGGHVEDEEEEAEQSHEIQEGRLENSSRRDISHAVSHMTSAEQGLTARNTAAALQAATQAVEALQRAFGRNRYILRTLASRTTLDPSRRLTGARDDAERGVRTLATPAGDADARRARELLVRVLDLVAQAQPRGSARSTDVLPQLSEIAEAALAVKPDDRSWQETSAAVLRLRERISSGGDAARTDDAVREVVRRLTTQARLGIPTITAPDGDLQRLEGALMSGGRGR
jgi:hypothetical protein